MRKRLLLLTLLMSFSVPVVAHNEFNGGVGSAPNFETIQEKRIELINKRYYTRKQILEDRYQALMKEYGMFPTKASQKKLQKIERRMHKVDERYLYQMQRIEERDGKRIEERDGKKVDAKKVDGKRAKNVKKKIKNAIKNKKANK